MIYEEKTCCCILLTDQTSLTGCIYLVRHWAICVLRLPSIMKLTLMFQSSCFFYMIKKSRQKFKYLDNEKTFYDELKSIFHHFQSALIEANKAFFFFFCWGGGSVKSPTWRSMKRHLLFRSRICKYLTLFSNINRAFKMFSSKSLSYFCHNDFIRSTP